MRSRSERFFSYKCGILASITIFLLLFLIVYGPIVTPERYLTLADQRNWLSIPNTWNVLSNIPFLFVGAFGLQKFSSIVFNDPKEKIFYVIFFIGVFLVGLGSSYYHWRPNNFHLMWDRFPIAIAMTAFISAIIAERIDLPFGRFILWPLLIFCLLSVYYWYFTITHNQEDVRIYTFFLVFFPIVLTPLILLMFKTPYTKSKYIWIALITFIVARITEGYDLAIYNFSGHFVSGHTLKHLLVALSCFFVFCYLRGRRVD